MLVNNASFVVSQVTSYEDAADEDEVAYMLDAPCMRTLIGEYYETPVPKYKVVKVTLRVALG